MRLNGLCTTVQDAVRWSACVAQDAVRRLMRPVQDAARVQSGCIREQSGSGSSTVKTKPERNQGAINITLIVLSPPTRGARIHLLPTRWLTTFNLRVTTRPKIHVPATTPASSHPHLHIRTVKPMSARPGGSQPPKDAPPKTPQSRLAVYLALTYT